MKANDSDSDEIHTSDLSESEASVVKPDDKAEKKEVRPDVTIPEPD